MKTKHMMTTAAAATVVVGLGAAGVVAAQAEPNATPAAAPGAGVTEVVAGTLSPTTFQTSLLRAYEEKKAADVAAMTEALKAKWEAEAAAAQQAAYEQAVASAVVANWQSQAAANAYSAPAAAASAPAPAASAPVQAASAPAQTYSAPAQTYSAPAPAASTASASGAASGDASSWASSGAAMAVKQCESGNNYSTNTGNGYYGAWQFDLPSWHANGGGAYAATPDQAPAWAQDQVAYNYYSVAGWGPWACAQ